MVLEKVVSKTGKTYYKKDPETNKAQFKACYEKNKFEINKKKTIFRIASGQYKVTLDTIQKFDIQPLEVMNKVRELMELYPDNQTQYLTHQKRFLETIGV